MKSRWLRILCLLPGLLTGFTLTLSAPSWVSAAPIIELKTNTGEYQGKNVAHNEKVSWVASPDGSYQSVLLDQVISFKKLTAEFQPLSTTKVAEILKQELDRNYEVQTQGKYVICAPKGKAGAYGDILSEVDRSFSGYFSRRNWTLANTEYPLVVVIHPSRQKFDEACQELSLPTSSLLQGFYHPHSNRVVLYDIQELPKSASTANLKSAISEDARKTIIHEAIHQLAFNTGLHSRIGQNPRWVVEGLATNLEEGGLQSRVKAGTASRINVTRLNQFRNDRAKDRNHTITSLITDDETLYKTDPINFYSEAWAFNFYLSEQRRPDYINYLKRIAQRNPLSETYSPEDRLADFQAVFGKDTSWIEIQFLRFIDGLPE
ncbi:DUF1570 domain-containing protein [Planctomicrobium sp. SH527]|uniref:DUF1570 domain-containing protein n=1 Tax=Planctomicrobium sp. SH527 TaxID=3448123 RepID=UPI003F5C7AB8